MAKGIQSIEPIVADLVNGWLKSSAPKSRV